MTLLLAGDLGGTKTLLALYRSDGDQLSCVARERYISAEWPHLGPMLKSFLGDHNNNGAEVAAGCIAVAGPVRQSRAHITNLPWDLEQSALAADGGLKQLELVNDFAVLVYGLPHLSEEQQVVLQQGEADPQGPIAILGAGTGLGMASGVRLANGALMTLPSEGGHREFPPRNAEEMLMLGWLRRELQLERLSIERIVSGTGLGLVFLWLLHCGCEQPISDLHQAAMDWQQQAPGTPGRPDLPALVAQRAREGDVLASKAEQIWLGAYGSAAGDLALQTLSTGGLWVGGGTAIKQLERLQSEAFLAPMRCKGRFEDFINKLPVRALVDPDAGLFSAACRARMLAGCLY